MKQFKLPVFPDNIKGSSREKSMMLLYVCAYVHDMLIPATGELQTFTSHIPVCDCCGDLLFRFNPNTNYLDNNGQVDHINSISEQRKTHSDTRCIVVGASSKKKTRHSTNCSCRPMYKVGNSQNKTKNEHHKRRKGAECCNLCNSNARFNYPISTPAITPVSQWSAKLLEFWVDNIDKPYIRNYIKLHFRPLCSSCNQSVSKTGYCLKETTANNITHNTTTEHKGIIKSSLELDSIYRTKCHGKPDREVYNKEKNDERGRKYMQEKRADPAYRAKRNAYARESYQYYRDYYGVGKTAMNKFTRNMANKEDIDYDEAWEKIRDLFRKFHEDPNIYWKGRCAGGKGNGKGRSISGWVDKRTDIIVWSKTGERIGERASGGYKIYKETGEPFWK